MSQQLDDARAELARLERMVEGQRELVHRLEAQQLPPQAYQGYWHFDTCDIKYGGQRCTCGASSPGYLRPRAQDHSQAPRQPPAGLPWVKVPRRVAEHWFSA